MNNVNQMHTLCINVMFAATHSFLDRLYAWKVTIKHPCRQAS